MKRIIIFVQLLMVVFSINANATLGTLPTLATSNVPEASQYQLVYQLDLDNLANNVKFNSGAIPYTVNNSATTGISFTRIAYLVDLGTKWVWVSFDKFGSPTLAQIGIPNNTTNNNIYQQVVNNMNVYSSSGSGVTNGTCLSGNVEMWTNCYYTNKGITLPGGVGDGSTYDFNDQPYTTNCYGSFQVHNYVAAQTIFAFNNFCNSTSNNDLGIGNQTTGNPDWTFAYNAANYSVKKIYIMVNSGSYISSNPLPANINYGSNATFTVATSSSLSLTYQWKENGVNITNGGIYSGATTATLTLTKPNVAKSGKSYTCVVTNSCSGSETSSAGLLTVNAAPLTITAHDTARGYLQPNPTFTYTYTGFVNGDVTIATPPTASTTATASSATGTYPITFSGASDPNYTINYVPATLTIKSVIRNGIGYDLITDAININNTNKVIDVYPGKASEDFNLPIGYTLNINDGTTFSNNNTITNNGTINLQGSSTFINHSLYIGNGVFHGAFINASDGTVAPGN